MRKKTFLILFIFLNLATSTVIAHDAKLQNFPIGKVKAAVRSFSSCVRSERAVFDNDHKICGVEAESRTELRSYLVCPSLKGYVFSRRLEVDAQRGRFLYSCAGHPDVVIAITFDSDQLMVTGIGELLP
jgi:hypothetical protein